MYERPWGPPKPEDAEHSYFVDQLFQDWKRTHPSATVRDFWRTVVAGEVHVPQSPGDRTPAETDPGAPPAG